MRKREATFQAAFNTWQKHCWTGEPAAFELKRTLLRSLPLAAIKDHQIAALQQVATNGHIYKIPDDSVGAKPFDSFFLKGGAYVVIAYGKTLAGAYIVPIEAIVGLKDTGAVSIREEDAERLGRYVEFKRKVSKIPPKIVV